MTSPAMPFVTLLRRAGRSGYKDLLMHERMILQCYNVNEDDENGMHYILFIPDEKAYEAEVYDQTMFLNPTEILKAYNTGHSILLEKRKEVGAKPKEALEEFTVEENKITFSYYLREELVHSENCGIVYPLPAHSFAVDTILDALESLMNRIKPGGCCLSIDGEEMGLVQTMLESGDIHEFVCRFNRKPVVIPLIKSMLNGLKKVDRSRLVVQESELPDVYIVAFNYAYKGIEEVYFGYVLNFT